MMDVQLYFLRKKSSRSCIDGCPNAGNGWRHRYGTDYGRISDTCHHLTTFDEDRYIEEGIRNGASSLLAENNSS